MKVGSMSEVGSQRPAFAVRPEYYEYVARGYDLIADHYDSVEGRNAISERVRRASLQLALASFRPGDRILELGCGTGRDAVSLASHRIFIDASDVSPAMVEATRARADREGVGEFVRTSVNSAAVAANEGGPYDGAYSNGAVLNLEPNFRELAQGLTRTLRPGAPAVLTAANRLSLFELLLYPLALRPRKAFRKLSRSVPIPISREGFGKRYVVATRFLTPREFVAPFVGSFVIEAWRGLQVFTPPWNMVDIATRFRDAVTPLEAIENRLGHVRGVRSLGAIYLLKLRRKGI